MQRLIQAKLSVSQPGNPLEREADATADRVMRMPADSEHECDDCRAGKAGCTECASAGENEVLRKESAGSDPGPRHLLRPLGGGRPLGRETRGFFESRFGRSFGDVRIHADAAAHDSAGGFNARAYTRGSDIVFGAGEYSPHTTAGRHLLAHELAHVAQNGGSRRRHERILRKPDPDQSDGARPSRIDIPVQGCEHGGFATTIAERGEACEASAQVWAYSQRCVSTCDDGARLNESNALARRACRDFCRGKGCRQAHYSPATRCDSTWDCDYDGETDPRCQDACPEMNACFGPWEVPRWNCECGPFRNV